MIRPSTRWRRWFGGRVHADAAPRLTVSAAFACLPRGARGLVLAVVAALVSPALLSFARWVGLVEDGTLLAGVADRAWLAWGLAAIAAGLSVMLFEPPRGIGPRGYLRQLRDRIAAVRVDYDAALARRFPSLTEAAHVSHDSE